MVGLLRKEGEVVKKTYLALGVMESMFQGVMTAEIERRALSIDDARAIISAGATLCFRPKLESEVLRKMCGIDLKRMCREERNVRLRTGDILMVLDVERLEQIYANGEDPELNWGIFVAYVVTRSFPD